MSPSDSSSSAATSATFPSPSPDRTAGVLLTLVDIIERHHAQEIFLQNVEEFSCSNSVTAGRKSRKTDLNKEINAPRAKRGGKPRYPLGSEPEDRRPS